MALIPIAYTRPRLFATGIVGCDPLANMPGVQVPSMPVYSEAERAKHYDMLLSFPIKDWGQSFLDFDRFALGWNKDVRVEHGGRQESRDSLFQEDSRTSEVWRHTGISHCAIIQD